MTDRALNRRGKQRSLVLEHFECLESLNALIFPNPPPATGPSGYVYAAYDTGGPIPNSAIEGEG